MIRMALISSLVALLVGSSYALAQTNLETNAGIQFNFSTPGAGNLALGGAFLALADDASAAYTNPAGLTKLAEDQILIEACNWGYTHIFTDRGRLEGREPTNLGIDTISGIQNGEADDSVMGLSFLAYVYPRKNWSLAIYRHTIADFQANFSAQGAFLERTRSRNPVGGFPILTDGRLASLQNNMSLEIINHGVAAGYRLSDTLSIGVGVSYYDFSLSSVTKRFLPPLLEVPDFGESNVTGIQTQSGDDSSWGMTLGIIWQISQDWSLGGAYRQGPDFRFSTTSEPGVAAHPLYRSASPAVKEAVFHVPEVIGFGVSFNPTDKLRVSLDYDYIEYSALLGDFVDIFSVRELFDRDPQLEGFMIDDAEEVHLGFEYSLLNMKAPLFLRLGAWFDPDHSLRFEGDAPGLQAVYRARDDQIHYTVGFGVLSGKYRFDVAVDYSERLTVGAVSAGVRF